MRWSFPGDGGSRFIRTGVVYLGVSRGQLNGGSWPSLLASGQGPEGCCLEDLGTKFCGGEPLAVLAALVRLALPVPGMTFLPGLLSGFLAYLYTWYCFPKLSSFEKRMQSVPLEAFIQGLVDALTRYLRYRYLNTDLMHLDSHQVVCGRSHFQ